MDFLKSLKEEDPEVYKAVVDELTRQRDGLEMIPSENFASPAVLEAIGSVLTNKYSEGYSGKRYYGGNQFIDVIERLAVERAKKLFNVPHANVQPYSGSPANLTISFTVCKPGDTVMGQNLTDGGHLTHGWKTSLTGMVFNSVPYHVRPDGYIDIEEARRLAMEHKPKLIWIGSSAYSREFPFEEFSKIADECGAYLAADISHITGLILAGAHKSATPYAHIIMTTTHKTLRGPRGAMIMVTERGLKKDPELAEKIDKMIFPGMQGGPHNNTTAGIAVALLEASTPQYREHGHQVVKNSKALADELMKKGIKLVTNGTDNHMILVDLTPFGKGTGVFVQDALDTAGITVNKNTIPNDPASPFYPSGIRLGTPTLTTRGMKEQEMREIADMIFQIIAAVKQYQLPEGKEERAAYIKKFKEEIQDNAQVKSTRSRVLDLCKKFPLYPDM